jgi:hypothetical protein
MRDISDAFEQMQNERDELAQAVRDFAKAIWLYKNDSTFSDDKLYEVVAMHKELIKRLEQK